MLRTALLIEFLLFCVLQVCLGCTSCNHDSVLAELASKQGSVERNLAATRQEWAVAAVGATFHVGDAARTARSSTALLALEGGGRLTIRPESLVRFLRPRPKAKAKDFVVESGQVLVEAGDTELLLTTELGLAKIERNGQVVIQRTPQGLQFDIKIGTARFENADGTVEVSQGRSYVIAMGRAVLDTTVASDTGAAADLAKQAAREESSRSAAEPGLNDSGVSAISVRVSGTGVTQKSPSASNFEALPEGEARVTPGSTIHAKQGSSIELLSDQGNVTLMGSGIFQLGAEHFQINLQAGKIAASRATVISVPGGTIQIKEHAGVVVEAIAHRAALVQVDKGSATVAAPDGTSEVKEGERGVLDPDGSFRIEGRSLGYADLVIHVGESATIHDPRPPTAVRFLFDERCPSGGTIRVGAKSKGPFASGAGSVALALAVGRHEYALHCRNESGSVDTPVARGTLIVLRDDGTRPVPVAPPSSSVATDGRSYTIMYQNQLPKVTVTWPNAPQSANFKLFVESRSATKAMSTGVPRYSFAPGVLGEGHHVVHFEGGGKSSRHTDISIEFDNAAPTANLTTSTNLQPDGEGNITVSGTVQSGWRVEIDGAEITQDAKRRFSQSVLLPQAQRAVSVKLLHPTRGTHLYLRRLRGTDG